MDKVLRSKLMDLALRAHFACESFNDVSIRAAALEERDQVPIKNEVRASADRAAEFLDTARRILAEDAAGKEGAGRDVSTLVRNAHPGVILLESSVGPLKTAVLDAETRAAIRAIEGRAWPKAPFELRPGSVVVDAELFRRALEGEMVPMGARWRIGALLSDLRDLKRVMASAEALAMGSSAS